MSQYKKPQNSIQPNHTANTPPLSVLPRPEGYIRKVPPHPFWAERQNQLAAGTYEMPKAIRLVTDYQSPKQRQMSAQDLTAQIIREKHILEVLQSDSQQWQHLREMGLNSKLEVPHAGIDSAIRGAVSLLVLDERRENQKVSDKNFFMAVEHRLKQYKGSSLGL